MRMRRRDGQPKYQPLEVDECEMGKEVHDTNHGIGSIDLGTSPKSGMRRLCGGGGQCAMLVKILVGTFISLIVMDIMFLEYQALTFGNPCQIAQDTKRKLASSPRKINGKVAPPLPKIIHQQWKTDKIPEGVFTEYHAQWKKLFPEPQYKHMLWTDDSGRKLIAEHFPWFLDAFDGYSMNIQRADSMRYFILYKYGGLYADLDYEPFVIQVGI